MRTTWGHALTTSFSLGHSEILSESTSSLDASARSQAAILASRVYFHLGEFDEALSFALGAGDAFNVDVADEYTENIVSKAIDSYIAQNSQHSPPSDAASPDARLVKVVNSMFERCINAGEFKPAIGIALETRRLDIVEQVFEHTGRKNAEILGYTLEAVMGIGGVGVAFRQEVNAHCSAGKMTGMLTPTVHDFPS